LIPNNALCHLMLDQQAAWCLVVNGQLYALDHFTSLADWLQAAAGRPSAAITDLLDGTESYRLIGPAAQLNDPDAGIRYLAPIDAQEVWAFGVTYEMSREARMRESNAPTIYGQVYSAERPEIFFKATGPRVVASGDAVAIRADSTWNVPEAELTLLLTPALEIIGYTIGNDMSSRDIEGQNPLYLPQAKVYTRSCALGPFIVLAEASFNPVDIQVDCRILRAGGEAFAGSTYTSRIHRRLSELADWLGRCNEYPQGVFAMTGTGIVPPDIFTLAEGDIIEIRMAGLGALVNPVISITPQQGVKHGISDAEGT